MALDFPENNVIGANTDADLFLRELDQHMTDAEPYLHDDRASRDRDDIHSERGSNRRDRDRGDRHRERDKDRDRERSSRHKDRSREQEGDDDRRHQRSSKDRERDKERDRDRDRDRDERKSSRRSRRNSRSISPRSSRRSRSTERGDRRGESPVVPINKRKRKLNNWDVPPPGFENMTAEHVKATGMFPLPGQTSTGRPSSMVATATGMDPGRAALLYGGLQPDLPGRPKLSQGAAGPVALNASIQRQARRLYVGQIPFGIHEDSLADFFNNTMIQVGLVKTGEIPVVAVQINHDKNYAFVEFRNAEEATAAMAFDGITFQGQSLKIRRPKDYVPPAGQYDTPPPIHVPGVVSTNVPDSPNKIFVGGLPMYWNDEQVMELLKSFGELRAFNLVKDSTTSQSKGFAFCEYVDPGVTDLACQGLNNMELGDRKLVVQRASVGANKTAGGGLGGMSLPAGLVIPSGVPEAQATRILQLLNMVTPDELEDDKEYEEIYEDIREECSKFGKIIDLKIPRPAAGQAASGLGKIFIRYETEEEAMEALRALAGRKFSDRTVLTSFFEEEKYLNDDF